MQRSTKTWSVPDSLLGKLGGLAEVALRLVGLAEALGEARELDARGAALLERQARLEEAARLAPELGLRAQAPERGEQLRVAVALEQPALGALDPRTGFGNPAFLQVRRQFAVKQDQARHPLGGEGVLDDLTRERCPAERGGVARAGSGNARLHAVGGRDPAPAPLESAGVVGRASKQLDGRLHLVLFGERGRDRVALGELRSKAQHLVPGAGAALGAQQQTRGGDMLRPGAVQVAQRVARGGEVAVLERELGAAHQARGLQRLARAVGALEPAVAALEV